MENKLKIQIWSDVMCPYCYIGKRRIETAIEQFGHQEAIEVEWKSFQLDAHFIASPEDNIYDHLAEKYRKDKDWAIEMVENMTQNAKNSGLEFNFDKAILANSYHAHRLLHLAKKHHIGNELKELLFKAYMTDGKNINDLNTLSELAQNLGMNKELVEGVLHSDAYGEAVAQDIQMAQQIGIQGVPFFVFDNKYAVSGAQHVETFVKTLERVWEEGSFGPKLTVVNDSKGDSCGIDGCCD
ncbi:DsbA family protein [Flavobacterium sp. UMI-01]|uniref:DsbA family oxidoreductase n=1 Tax=Flavobacterium sp. UMI-01 TaxID=1441053 RepID=UPI001C7CAB64|nr:DsbA family oxidoreductase [Flavobacterium sp. UMI-01]GIZ09302.1 DSBA oxidoreductase [Flavobacterium sp. UMI-01]